MSRFEPFPHEDGAPASWEDNRQAREAEQVERANEAQVREYMNMILSTMK